MKKNIINKLAEWETALNKIPVEKRQGFIIKTGIVLLILLFVFVIGGKMYRTHKREAKKENIEKNFPWKDTEMYFFGYYNEN